MAYKETVKYSNVNAKYMCIQQNKERKIKRTRTYRRRIEEQKQGSRKTAKQQQDEEKNRRKDKEKNR